MHRTRKPSRQLQTDRLRLWSQEEGMISIFELQRVCSNECPPSKTSHAIARLHTAYPLPQCTKVSLHCPPRCQRSSKTSCSSLQDILHHLHGLGSYIAAKHHPVTQARSAAAAAAQSVYPHTTRPSDFSVICSSAHCMTSRVKWLPGKRRTPVNNIVSV